MKKELILAFETNIGGGSISLYRDKKEIDSFTGDVIKSVAKAEDLLINISEMFRRNQIYPNDLKVFVYAEDNISRTGFRIVSAIVKGLKDSIRCKVFKVSILEVLAKSEQVSGNLLVAVQINEKLYYRRLFARDILKETVFGLDDTKTVSAEVFWQELRALEISEDTHITFVCENDEILGDFPPNRLSKYKSSANFASLIAKDFVR